MRQQGMDGVVDTDGPAATGRALSADPVVVGSVALADLFASHAQRLIGALTVYTGDPGVAEDLAQEAFARLHVSHRQLRDPEATVSYLYSIAFNQARSRWRRQVGLTRALRRLGPTDESSPDVAVIVARSASTAAMTAAVGGLSERQRSCVVLRYYGDLSVADTAAALGISPNSVKTHLQRAFIALRHDLAHEDPS